MGNSPIIELTEAEKNASENFYIEALQILNESNIPYLLGGAFAFFEYTGIQRNTKDLDIFCRETDYQEIIKYFTQKGFKVEITDVRWLAKVFKDNFFMDIIFSNTSNIARVDDSWFENATAGEVFGIPVTMVGAEEMLWSKIYIQGRERFDGADVNHIILRYGKKLDWDRVMMRLKEHWHLLLAQFLMFQFIYPTEREMIPKDLFFELLEKAKEQYDFPVSVNKVCRGPLVDHAQYQTDIAEWGYKAMTLYTI